MRNSTALFAAFAGCLALGGLMFSACGDDDKTSSNATTAPSDAATSGGNSSSGATTKPAATTGAQSGAVDACKVFLKEDAVAALGNPTDLKEPTNNTQPPINGTTISTCSYFSASNGSTTLLLRKSDASAAQAVFDGVKKNAANAIDVPGVGDKAFYAPQLGQLNIVVKDTYLILSLGKVGAPAPTPSAALIALGKKLAGRI